MELSRRGFFAGAAALLVAPAIVRVGSIMPVSIVPIRAGIPDEFWLNLITFGMSIAQMTDDGHIRNLPLEEIARLAKP